MLHVSSAVTDENKYRLKTFKICCVLNIKFILLSHSRMTVEFYLCSMWCIAVQGVYMTSPFNTETFLKKEKKLNPIWNSVNIYVT